MTGWFVQGYQSYLGSSSVRAPPPETVCYNTLPLGMGIIAPCQILSPGGFHSARTASTTYDHVPPGCSVIFPCLAVPFLISSRPSNQNHARNAQRKDPANYLELLELLNRLSGPGKHAENVEPHLFRSVSFCGDDEVEHHSSKCNTK